MWRALIVVSLGLGLPAQPVAVPSAADLEAARGAVLDQITDLWSDAGGRPAFEVLRDAVRSSDDDARGYLLLQQTLRCAARSGLFAAAEQVVGELTDRFAVDRGQARFDMLTAFDRAASVPALALVEAFVQLAADTVETGDERIVAAAERAALDVAQRSGQGMIRARAEQGQRDLIAIRQAWQDVASGGDEARGRYHGFFLGRWQAAMQLLAAPEAPTDEILLGVQKGADEGAASLRIAESWLDRVRHETAAIAQRNLWRRALYWYRRAWPKLDGLERVRVTRQLDRLEGRLAEHDVLGRVTFDAADSIDRLLIQGGEWQVVEGELRGRNTGRATRATHPLAYTRIDAVTIRGGLRSVDNLNFRFTVGPLNVLMNWEVRPENHFYIGEHGVVTEPRALVRGREHEFRVRQLGDQIVVFLDGEQIFSGPGQLAGTVSVYPALGSEIFVRELSIEGQVDPLVPVEGPANACR